MIFPPKVAHPEGVELPSTKKPVPEPCIVDTYDGKVQIEWNPDAAVTPSWAAAFFYPVFENRRSLRSLGR